MAIDIAEGKDFFAERRRFLAERQRSDSPWSAERSLNREALYCFWGYEWVDGE